MSYGSWDVRGFFVRFFSFLDIVRGFKKESVQSKIKLGDVSDEINPFSDLKPLVNKYTTELWQHNWDKWPANKLHQIRTK